MIYVDRSTIAMPEDLNSAKTKNAKARARIFFYYFYKKHPERSQRRYDFDRSVWLSSTVKTALSELFKNKCAYCESPIGTAARSEIDHFRPIEAALNLDGEMSLAHYWWLAYEWQNLYLTCPICNSAKRNRFPIKRKRAAASTTGRALLREQPLLLDPCKDHPEKHFIFLDNGMVIPRGIRGKVTIETLSLNRSALFSARLAAIQQVKTTLGLCLASGSKEEILGMASEVFSLSAPYFAARLEATKRWVKHNKPRLSLDLVKSLPDKILRATRLYSEAKERKALSDFQKVVDEESFYSVEVEDIRHKNAYYVSKKYIESIEIRNFKGIGRLDLKFPEPKEERGAWLMLIGENATGKSSVLQGVALALMGEKRCNSLNLKASTFVNLHSRAVKGMVKIKLTGMRRPITLTAKNGENKFEVEPKDPKVLLMGYGATRLLPYRGRAASRFKYLRMKNLFDPTTPLQDAETWLRSRDPKEFEQAAEAIENVLLLPTRSRLVREGRSVFVKFLGKRFPLQDLSDGYQSVLALVVDIFIAARSRWSSVRDAEGIVLLDEIEVHLHPQWKLEIVKRFRSAFPQLTFLVTTHDPLCLRGLSQDEIVLLRRDDSNRVVAVTDLPKVDHLRADQILTSFLFGLTSTRSQGTAAMISRYSKLLSKEKRNLQEEKELEELKMELDNILLTGETPLQRKGEQTVEKAVTSFLEEYTGKILSKPQLTPPMAMEIKRQIAELVDPKSIVS